MKSAAFLLSVQLVAAVPQLQYANGRPKIPTSNPRAQFKADCKVIASDAGWPAADVWKQAMPKVAVKGNIKAGTTAPDYKVVATNTQEVMQAVRFANDHNVRLSILNSGHGKR
jgi:uroporphyrinogen-III decarboxylase